MHSMGIKDLTYSRERGYKTVQSQSSFHSTCSQAGRRQHGRRAEAHCDWATPAVGMPFQRMGQLWTSKPVLREGERRDLCPGLQGV